MAKNGKQDDLVTPEQTEVDKKVEILVGAYETLKEQKEKVTKIKAELMPMMKKAKRYEVKFGGFKIKYRAGSDGISISKEANKE